MDESVHSVPCMGRASRSTSIGRWADVGDPNPISVGHPLEPTLTDGPKGVDRTISVILLGTFLFPS